MVSGLTLNCKFLRLKSLSYVKYGIFTVKFCSFFYLSDRASSASTTQTMKIIEFSLFGVLVFKGLRNNKPDKLFGKPLSFFFGRKNWQKEPHARYPLLFFREPCGLKNSSGSFFLRYKRVKKEEPKKETLEKNRLNKTGKKNPGRGGYAGYSFIGQRY